MSDDAPNAVPTRPIPAGVDLETPLMTLVWRAAQRWSEEVQLHKQQLQAAGEREQQAWIALADECFGLQRLCAGLPEADPDTPPDPLVRKLTLAARRLARTLAEQGVELVVPEGEAYTGELSEVIESASQIAEPGLESPRVQEVLTPAVTHNSQYIRLGTAVIAVPAEPEQGET